LQTDEIPGFEALENDTDNGIKGKAKEPAVPETNTTNRHSILASRTSSEKRKAAAMHDHVAPTI